MSSFACLYIFQKHSYAVEKVSFLLKPEDDLFDFLQIKKKSLHVTKNVPTFYTLIIHVVIFCVFTQRTIVILFKMHVHNACHIFAI